MAGGFGEGCVCMMFMCAVPNSQEGYERLIHSNSQRFYRCLALTSTVIVAHLSIVDGGMAIGAVSGSRATIRTQYPGLASFLSSSASVGKLMGRYRRGSFMNLACFAPTSSYEMRLHMGEGHPARAPIVTA